MTVRAITPAALRGAGAYLENFFGIFNSLEYASLVCCDVVVLFFFALSVDKFSVMTTAIVTAPTVVVGAAAVVVLVAVSVLLTGMFQS